jgi:hypothetical protein
LLNNFNGEAEASPPNIQSQPTLRSISTYPYSTPYPTPLVHSQLLQRLEQLCIIFQNLCDQFIPTCRTLLTTKLSRTSTHILLTNATTLLSQLDTTLSICTTYGNQFPHFRAISSLLSPIDQAILLKKNIVYCTTLWNLLKYPSPPILRNIIIRFISHLEVYQHHYLVTSLKTIPPFSFIYPRNTSGPSIISQVTHTEATIDPYLKSLQENYYYPLSSDMTSMDMQIEHNEDSDKTIALSLGARSTITLNDRKITVEDSVDAILDLITEIQATERVEIPMTTPPLSSPSTSMAPLFISGPNLPIRFSLARQKRTSSPSSNLLPSIRKFFHTLLSTKAVTILPVRSNERAVVGPPDAGLLAQIGDGVLITETAPLVLGVGGLFLSVLPCSPPLLLVTLMLESIVGGC